MNSLRKEQIETGLLDLRNRVKSEADRDNEIVKIGLDVMLKGQEAVNYEVVKLFAENLTHQALVQLVFRIGLRGVTELVKALADNNGIRL